jgi:hypothetical protein
MPLEIRAVFGEPGAYTADVIPMQAGSYIFQVFGTIEETQVDEQFNSADGQIADVEPLDTWQFPTPADASEQEALVASQQEVNTARLLGLVGAGLGVLGLLAGIVALVRR